MRQVADFQASAAKGSLNACRRWFEIITLVHSPEACLRSAAAEQRTIFRVVWQCLCHTGLSWHCRHSGFVAMDLLHSKCSDMCRHVPTCSDCRRARMRNLRRRSSRDFSAVAAGYAPAKNRFERKWWSDARSHAWSFVTLVFHLMRACSS